MEEEDTQTEKEERKNFQQTFFKTKMKNASSLYIEVGSRRALSIKRTSINHDAPHERREEE